MHLGTMQIHASILYDLVVDPAHYYNEDDTPINGFGYTYAFYSLKPKRVYTRS